MRGDHRDRSHVSEFKETNSKSSVINIKSDDQNLGNPELEVLLLISSTVARRDSKL